MGPYLANAASLSSCHRFAPVMSSSFHLNLCACRGWASGCVGGRGRQQAPDGRSKRASTGLGVGVWRAQGGKRRGDEGQAEVRSRLGGRAEPSTTQQRRQRRLQRQSPTGKRRTETTFLRECLENNPNERESQKLRSLRHRSWGACVAMIITTYGVSTGLGPLPVGIKLSNSLSPGKTRETLVLLFLIGSGPYRARRLLDTRLRLVFNPVTGRPADDSLSRPVSDRSLLYSS